MGERIHGLAQLLPGKTSLEDCSLEELQHIAKRYPFFAPAQFLLLQKLKEHHSADYEAMQQKAVLYYPDPLQFDAFISPEKFYGGERFEDNLSEEPSQPFAFTGHDESTLIQEQNDLTAFSYRSNGTHAAEETAVEEEQEEQPAISENIVSEPAPEPGNGMFSEPDKVEEKEEREQGEPAILPVAPLQENTAIAEDIQPEETEPVTPDEERSIVEAPSLAVTKAEDLPLPKEEETVQEQQEDAAASPVLAEQPSAVAVEQPVFEPYHTVDYFASQGIKVSVEDLSKDKLSKQLRSFTEWLKMMKRLPAAEMGQKPESPAEKTVETMASHSVEGSDVLTEAMAEVWAKQGNTAKAIETYNKLSLLNPSKRAYFAAKIENLSGT